MTGKIVVLGTGGTIAGLRDGQSPSYTAGVLGIEALMPDKPVATNLALECRDLYRIDSKDVSLEHWQTLVEAVANAVGRPDVWAVLITHGTDTMEETAWLLQQLLGHQHKPIVLTGAMRPSDHPSPDGPGNLIDAISVACDEGARGKGVMVVMAGAIHSARAVRKTHAWELGAFTSGFPGVLGHVHGMMVTWDGLNNMPPKGTQGDSAVFCQIKEPALFECPRSSSLNMPCAWQALHDDGLDAIQRSKLLDALRVKPWPWVEVVLSGALSTSKTVHALVDAGVQGLVVVGTGMGTLHSELTDALSVKSHLPLVLTTFTEANGVLPMLPDGNWLGSSCLGPRKSKISLALCLMMQEM